MNRPDDWDPVQKAENEKSKAEISKDLENAFAEYTEHPDPKIRKQAAGVLKMLKEEASRTIDCLIPPRVKILKPTVPKGYRLPTYAEYQELSRLQDQYDTVSALIDVSSGKGKKDLIAQRHDIWDSMDDIIEAKKIYFVRESNYFTDGGEDSK